MKLGQARHFRPRLDTFQDEQATSSPGFRGIRRGIINSKKKIIFQPRKA